MIKELSNLFLNIELNLYLTLNMNDEDFLFVKFNKKSIVFWKILLF